jgi:uncharacterized protein (TIGR02145 family)
MESFSKKEEYAESLKLDSEKTSNGLDIDIFIDPRDGKVYKTAKIGTQTWLAENLNYEAKGSVCYENNPDNGAKYGRLYDWETAKKACPEGWHLPTNEEWDKLFRFVDGDAGSESPYDSETAGKHLKAASGWEEDGGGTDEYGFSALPGGLGYSDGIFFSAGNYGYWWSASEYSSYGAYYRYMNDGSENASWDHSNKSILFSVRCLLDSP